MCRSVLTCANGVADGGNIFSEQSCTSPPVGVAGLGVVRPGTDARNSIKRAGPNQFFGASAQEVLFYGRVLCELGKSAKKMSA